MSDSSLRPPAAPEPRAFTDLFIRRPVIAIVVNLIIIIAGLQAIRTLNVRQYPRSENAAITVTTVYVGASAELVRGFITTPLERVIASADGIDYLESTSTQGLSTITARLRLNYDSTKALAEISSKVDQVRGRPAARGAGPGAQHRSTADSQFASAYLSFSSEFLKQNEITDYLVRVVQPRLSALEGVQKADILGARTFAMRIWLKPDRMAALNVEPGPGPPGAGGQQLPGGGRPDQGLAGPGEPHRQHRPALGGRVQAAGHPAERRGGGPPVGRGRRGARRRGLRHRGELHRPDRGVHRRLGAPQRQLARRDQAGPGRAGGDPEGAAGADQGHHRLRRAPSTSRARSTTWSTPCGTRCSSWSSSSSSSSARSDRCWCRWWPSRCR